MAAKTKTKMNKRIKERWLKALRSGKYPQGRNRLRQDNKYCCLGVLCEIAAQSKIKGEPVTSIETFKSNDISIYYYDKERHYLPWSVVRWAGLPEQKPTVKVDGDGMADLAYLNDKGYTFEQIADLIEANL